MLYDLLNENTNLFVEATNIGIEPSLEGAMKINMDAMQESFVLEASIVSTLNKQVLTEGAMVLNENMFKNIYDRIIEIIKKMWAKMKEFFSNLRLFFDRYAKKNGAFAEKYEKEIQKISSVSVDGYSFTPAKVDIKSLFEKGMDAIESTTGDKSAPVKSSDIEKAYYKAMGASDSKDFNKKISTLCGYKGTKTPVKYSGSEILKAINGQSDFIEKVNDDKEAVDDAYTKAIEIAEQTKKKFSDNESSDTLATKDKDTEAVAKLKSGARNANGNKAANQQKLMDGAKNLLAAINIAAGIKSKCYKEDATQAKTAAYKGIAESRKNASKDK